MKSVIGVALIILYSSLVSFICFLAVPKLMLFNDSVLYFALVIGVPLVHGIISQLIHLIARKLKIRFENCQPIIFAIICGLIIGVPTTICLFKDMEAYGNDAFVQFSPVFFCGILPGVFFGGNTYAALSGDY
jgi:hypothetical protein